MSSPGPILVVDDDPSIREMLVLILETRGFDVRQAADGMKALERARAEPPSLILLDLMMPGMDGFEVLEAMRRHEKWSDIPVIVITAKDLTREERAWLRGCAEKIVQKSACNRVELVRVIEGMIERRVNAAS